eukprot:scaffold2686_cov57-Phaeocystis_antarctica.AAC.3
MRLAGGSPPSMRRRLASTAPRSVAPSRACSVIALMAHARHAHMAHCTAHCMAHCMPHALHSTRTASGAPRRPGRGRGQPARLPARPRAPRRSRA